MLTLENLKEFGANVEEGVTRCLDDEEFYIDLVNSSISDSRIDELEELIAAGDFDKAFEVAHALKGMYGNISLTPLFKPVSEITEKLRRREQGDYSDLLNEAKAQKAKLVGIYNARN